MTEPDFEPVFHILHDLPEDKDAFGPHQKVADTLATMIAGPAQAPDPDTDHAGYFVALEGGWGSGKSTVVKMLRKALAKKEAIQSQVVIFDAWAHSGDHLRRAFLEVIINALDKTDWYKDKSNLQKERVSLSGRHKESTEKRTPKYSVWGILFGLSLLLLPVGGVLASVTLGKTATDPNIFNFISNACLARSSILLCFLPLIILLIASCVAFFSKDHTGQRKNAWGLMLNQWDTETDIHTTTDPDTSSIEFQKKFQNFVSHALSKECHRLVLVIDNLDRLPPRDAMHLWRTLQTFVDKNEHGKQVWQGKLWTLVPYDREALNQHFKNQTVINCNPDSFPQPDSYETNHGELEHFEKIFDVRLHVPAPLLARWQMHFKDLLYRAFPKASEQSVDDSLRLLNAFGLASTPPRTMKRYINAMGPIYLQWGRDFELALILLYVLATQKSFNFDPYDNNKPSALPQSSLIPMIVGQGYADKLAAIANNSPIEDASQNQDLAAIGEALKEGQAAVLRSLKAQTTGFFTLLEYSIGNYLSYADLTNLVPAAAAIINSGILTDADNKTKQSIRTTFSFYISIHYGKHLESLPIVSSQLNDKEPYSSSFVSYFFQHDYKHRGDLRCLLELCNATDVTVSIFEMLIDVAANGKSRTNVQEQFWYEALKECSEHLAHREDVKLMRYLAKHVLETQFAGPLSVSLGGDLLLDRMGLPKI